MYYFLKNKLPLKLNEAMTSNENQVKSFAFLRTALLGMGLALASNSVYAVNWQYLGAYNTSTGRPSTLEDLSSQLPSDLLTKVRARLPEGSPIGKDPTALAMLTDDLGANIFLKANAAVKVSYITEGAGYLNSVGFFTFNKADLATVAVSQVQVTEKIMFPNFSDTILSFGKSVNVGQVNAGSAIGFTIIANGWQASNGRVNTNKSPNGIFRTIKRLNPESGANNLNAHTILFSDAEHGMLVLAFEDLNRANASYNDYGYMSDDDFNDVIIAIQVTPFSAVDTTNIPPLTVLPPKPLGGESGPIGWREINAPNAVVDSIKEAKAKLRAAQTAP